MTPFYALHGYHPRFTVEPTTSATENPRIQEVANRLSKNHEVLQDNIRTAQERYKEYYDKKHLPFPQYKPGDKVYVSNLEQFSTGQPSKKLQPKRWGPTEITEVLSKHIVRIKLPPNLSKKVTDIYNILQLVLCPKSGISRQYQIPPPPVIIDGEPEYEVEEILDVKKTRNRFKYLVKWVNDDPTWQPMEDLTNCQELLQDFYSRYPQKPRPSSFS